LRLQRSGRSKGGRRGRDRCSHPSVERGRTAAISLGQCCRYGVNAAPCAACARYRGRRPGLYELSDLGRIRKRGASGGGTLCSDDPQLLQNSCRSPSTRSQWPRAGQSGFRHCTVHPGKYCIVLQFEIRAKSARTTPIPPVRAELAGKMAELCGKRPCVSTRIHTISSGAVAKEKPRGRMSRLFKW
jgi:hypothetical protein